MSNADTQRGRTDSQNNPGMKLPPTNKVESAKSTQDYARGVEQGRKK